MINFDVTKDSIKEHSPNWSQSPDNSYRILIIEGSGSGKSNALLNLITNQSMHLYAKKCTFMQNIPMKQKINF